MVRFTRQRRVHIDPTANTGALRGAERFGAGQTLKLTLSLSATYLAVIGLALLFVPLHFGVGAVPADASPQLIALLRLLGGPFLGIAALNWLSRDAGHSALLRAVLIANIIGFGIVAANDLWGVVTGEAREIARYFLAVHLLFTAAFVAVARANWRHD